jgi:hypothetical protein
MVKGAEQASRSPHTGCLVILAHEGTRADDMRREHFSPDPKLSFRTCFPATTLFGVASAL